MIGRAEVGSDQLPVDGLFALGERLGGNDPRRLDLSGDRAVLVQVPVEPVVVVAYGDDERDHEATSSSHLDVPGAEVGVLPERAGVFLVKADTVDHLHGCPIGCDIRDVEVPDQAEAVAAEHEGVRHRPEVELADVER
jgi:hypothetical protein